MKRGGGRGTDTYRLRVRVAKHRKYELIVPTLLSLIVGLLGVKAH